MARTGLSPSQAFSLRPERRTNEPARLRGDSECSLDWFNTVPQKHRADFAGTTWIAQEARGKKDERMRSAHRFLIVCSEANERQAQCGEPGRDAMRIRSAVQQRRGEELPRYSSDMSPRRTWIQVPEEPASCAASHFRMRATGIDFEMPVGTVTSIHRPSLN